MGGIFGQGRGGFEGDDGVLKRVALGEEGRLSLVLSGGRKGFGIEVGDGRKRGAFDRGGEKIR